MTNDQERKAKWYQENKTRLKIARETKRKQAKKPSDYFVLTFLVVCILIISSVLVIYSTEILGTHPIGWITAIMLEVGVLTLTVMSPKKSTDWWVVKIAFCFTIAVSFLVLKNGTESRSRVKNLRMTITENLATTARNMPVSYSTKRQAALTEASRNLDMVSYGNFESELAIRVALLLMNLIFAHALYRMAF